MTIAMLLAGPACADTPAFSIGFESGGTFDGVEARGADVEQAVPTFDGSANPSVRVRLATRFDPLIAKLTSGHVGETAVVRICGEIVSEPRLMSPIHTADFIITTKSSDEAARLAVRIASPDCEPVS